MDLILMRSIATKLANSELLLETKRKKQNKSDTLTEMHVHVLYYLYNK